MKTRERIVLAALIVGLIAAGSWGVSRIVRLRPAEETDTRALTADEPGEGIGRNPAAVRYLSAPSAGEIRTAYRLDTYTEGDGPAPEWYRPDEPMSAEWEDGNALQSDAVDYIAHPPIGIDPGGVDWNLCTTVWGWDGHVMEAWEMDAFARVAYLEFWGTSQECCEAGVDAILQLWDSEYFAPTLYGTLSAEAENGAPVFSTWEAVL